MESMASPGPRGQKVMLVLQGPKVIVAFKATQVRMVAQALSVDHQVSLDRKATKAIVESQVQSVCRGLVELRAKTEQTGSQVLQGPLDPRATKVQQVLVDPLETWDLAVPRATKATLVHQGFLDLQAIVVSKVSLVMSVHQGKLASEDLSVPRVTLERLVPLVAWDSRAPKVTRVIQVLLGELVRWAPRVRKVIQVHKVTRVPSVLLALRVSVA